MNMDKPKSTIGPFRATKLWNTIISDFRSGIPLKRHRWRMRHYDNCFTSTEAIDWLHNYLCNSENFGPWVTRQQVVLLLDKFVQSKIIEEIQTSKVPATEKASFEDNGHLYKFLPVSPMKKLRSALASRSSIQSLSPSPKVKKSVARTMQGRVTQPLALRDTNVIDVRPPESSGARVTKELPRCTLISRPLTTEQVEGVWKSATLKRLERLLWLSTLDGLLDDSVIVPSDIIHNCTHINRNGVVQLLKKEGDLPHWVLSAMRCLANWPSKIDSELPNYPGFERDVFKTVSNYFQNLSEPLITYSRYNLVVDSFVSMECRDRGIVPGQEVVTVYTGIRGGLTSFQSVESLMLNMTTGGGNLSARASGRERLARRDGAGSVAGRKVRRSTSCGLADLAMQGDTPHLPNNVAGMPRRGLNQRFGSTEVLTHKNTFLHKNYNVYSASATRPQGHRMSNAEDDYGFANMPPLLPPKKSSLAEVSSISDKSAYGNMGSISADVPPRKCSSLSNITEAGKKETLPKQKWGSGLFTSKRFGSAAELFGRLVKKKSSSYRELSDDSAELGERGAPAEQMTSSHQIVSPGLAPPPSYPVYNLSPTEGSSRKARESTLHSHTDDSAKVSPPYPAPIRATLSYCEISSGQQSFVTPNAHAELTPSGMPSAIIGSTRCSRSLSNLHTSTPMYENLAQTAQRCLRRQDSINSISSLYLSEDKSYCLEALRLCLLLLPPPQRRALHLLLRLMSKMETNAELVLSANVSTRQLLLNTFTRSILCCEAEADLDESLAVRIVAYLLDNHASLFTVPQELRQDIEERMMYLKRSQIKYEMDTENVQPAAFCAQVSVEEYEKQKTSSSQKAIEDLLDSIIADKVMPAKEKKKKLKLFQKAYPDIYHRRLPTSSSEAELFPDKPKIKQPMLNVKRSLSKLKPIR